MLYYGNTDVGMHRQINQDSFMTIPMWGGQATLLVVCDGMGGHKSGDVASKTAVETFVHSMFSSEAPADDDDENTVAAYIKFHMVSSCDAANKAVYKMSMENADNRGMGTTLVAALVYKNKLFAVNIGDSRLYMITKYSAIQVSRDHSFVQYLIDSGKLTEEEAKTYPRRNVITRAVGVGEKARVDFFIADLSEWEGGGYILLCSDGLSNYMDGELLFNVVYSSDRDGDETEAELEKKVNKLIEIANERGGADNITAVIGKF